MSLTSFGETIINWRQIAEPQVPLNEQKDQQIQFPSVYSNSMGEIANLEKFIFHINFSKFLPLKPESDD